jgi:hypothetical protein
LLIVIVHPLGTRRGWSSYSSLVFMLFSFPHIFLNLLWRGWETVNYRLSCFC